MKSILASTDRTLMPLACSVMPMSEPTEPVSNELRAGGYRVWEGCVDRFEVKVTDRRVAGLPSRRVPPAITA